MRIILLLFSLLISNLVQAQSNTILWKVTNPDSQHISYLLGNFHQLGDSFINSHPIIEEKIKQTDLVILETLDTDATQVVSTRNENDEIRKFFSSSDLKKIEKISPTFKQLLYRYTPIELSWKLQQEYIKKTCGGITPEDKFEVFDDYIYFLAKKNQIPSMGFATMQEQVDNLNKQYQNVTWKSEKKNILFHVKNLLNKKPVKTQSCSDVKDFRNLNIDYHFDKPCKSVVLLGERNDNWLDQLLPILKEKSTFISVGYFHLGFRCGFIKRLENLGFAVEPVQMK